MATDQPAGPAGPAEDDGSRDLVLLPAFQAGGKVERTGIALVHAGEYILPAPGSEATITDVPAAAGGTVVNFYFPVEVEVVGNLGAAQLKAVAEYVVEEFNTALRNRLG